MSGDGYLIVDLPPIGHPDLASVAMPRGARAPRLDHPPVRTYFFDAVLRFARICRVDRVIRPYLEALM